MCTCYAMNEMQGRSAFLLRNERIE